LPGQWNEDKKEIAFYDPVRGVQGGRELQKHSRPNKRFFERKEKIEKEKNAGETVEADDFGVQPEP